MRSRETAPSSPAPAEAARGGAAATAPLLRGATSSASAPCAAFAAQDSGATASVAVSGRSMTAPSISSCSQFLDRDMSFLLVLRMLKQPALPGLGLGASRGRYRLIRLGISLED